MAAAPVVARLEPLSLALGVLTDEGAEALLSEQERPDEDDGDVRRYVAVAE